MGSGDETSGTPDEPSWEPPRYGIAPTGATQPQTTEQDRADRDPFPTRTSGVPVPGPSTLVGPHGASSGPPEGEPPGRVGPPPMAIVHPLAPGQVVFGRYRVERKLGEGGMGTVWLVHHLALDAPRALKLIVQKHALDPTSLARFQREARVMALLSHPNAVVVHDAYLAQDGAFIEMAYVQGQSLDRLLEPGIPRPLAWTARVLEQLCDALQVAHDKLIVHRDIKPSNLMLVDGHPPGKEFLKVLDFGIAKILDSEDREDSLTRTGGAGFTPTYASPQQALGEPVDGRSDIYSIGVILYEFLTGHRPFGGPVMRLYYDLINTPPPPFAEKNPDLDLPPGIEPLVLRCLAKAPEDRPQSPREVWEAFHAAFTAAPARPATSQADPVPAGTQADTLAIRETVLATSETHGLGDDRYLLETQPDEGGATTRQARRDEDRHRRARKTVLMSAGIGGVALLLPLLALMTRERKPPGPGPVEVDPTKGVTPRVEPTPAARVRFRPEGTPGPDGRAPSLVSLGGQGIADEGAMTLALIEGGEFLMGDFAGSGPEGAANRPAHRVTLSPFYLQTTEVTNRQMSAYFRDRGIGPKDQPRIWKEARDDLIGRMHLTEREAGEHPAVGVDRLLADRFARWAGGRLPTEAEWEYAARSLGKDHPFVWGVDGPASISRARIDNLDDPLPTSPAASYADDRTEQGVFDMTGNVREWCLDAWSPSYFAAPSEDPRGPLCPDGNCTYVIRGGSFKSDADRGRTTFRADNEPEAGASNDLGFRIVVECGPAEAPRLGKVAD